MYLLVSLQVHSKRAVDCCIGPTMRGSCPHMDNLQLEDAVTLDLQGGAAVFNGKCAHAAEPSTNERCSVIGFTCVVGPERPREGSTHTHTRTHAHTHPHTHTRTHSRSQFCLWECFGKAWGGLGNAWECFGKAWGGLGNASGRLGEAWGGLFYPRSASLGRLEAWVGLGRLGKAWRRLCACFGDAWGGLGNARD